MDDWCRDVYPGLRVIAIYLGSERDNVTYNALPVRHRFAIYIGTR